MVGQRVGRYRVREKLGEGGMGEVYLADDTELKREVALKFLPEPLTTDRDTVERFRREAQTAAALSHPNIITIYEVGEHKNRPYIAMAYVPGEPLSEVIRGGLDGARALDFAIQIAEGLRCAHAAGVVHRDIKPDNIIIDSDGRARILDFGLAKLGGVSKLTQESSTMGTIYYMSPEQARGDEVDQRSDLFSLGSVLYEMLSGCRPFRGDHVASLIYSIINDDPPPLSQMSTGVKPEMARVVKRLLAKEAKDRYGTADDLLADLRRVESGLVPVGTIRPRRLATFLVPAGIVFLAVIALFVFKPLKIEIAGDQPAVAVENSLAIMYFENLVDPADPGRLGEIATNLLITDLSESDYLRVVSSQRLYDILKLEGREGAKRVDRDTATRVAERAGARQMLLGSILQQAPTMVLTAQLVDVQNGNVIQSYRVNGEQGETIFALVDDLTGRIKADLNLPAAARGEPDQPVAAVTTHSTDAYRYYLEGVENANKLYVDEAQAAFQKAVREDSTFAMAYRAMANFAKTEKDRREALEMAVRHADNCSKKERMYIESSVAMADRSFEKAVAVLESLLAEYPDEKSAMKTLGDMYRGLGDKENAIRRLREVIEVDPLDKLAYNSLAYLYQDIGDLENSLEAINKYIELAPDEPNPLDTRGDLYAYSGRPDAAIASYERALEIKPDFHHSLLKIGHMYLLTGRYDQARDAYRKGIAVPQARSAALLGLAMIPLTQGKLDSALKALEQGIASDELEGYLGSGRLSKYGAIMQVHLARDDFAGAEAAYRRLDDVAAAMHSQMRTTVRPYLVEMLCARGDLERARQELRELQNMVDEDEPGLGAVIPYARGVIALHAGDATAAAEDLEKVVALQPNILLRYRLGTAYLLAGRLSDAIEQFETILGRYSEDRAMAPILNVTSHYQLGLAYEKSGWRDRATEQYRIFLGTWKDVEQVEEVRDAKKRLDRLTRGS